MKRCFLWSIIGFFLLIGVLLIPLTFTAAKTPEEELQEKQKEIEELEKKLSQLQEAKKTLANQIKWMDSQIKLTSLKITQTTAQIQLLESQIQDLGRKIEVLDVSLNQLTAAFISRVIATYKFNRLGKWGFLLGAHSFNRLLRLNKYLEIAQLNDRKLLLAMEETRINYDAQKKIKEEKQTELTRLKNQLAQQRQLLAQQKKDKEYLLEVTENNEKKYQQMIARALAELEAIQQIIAGRGEEQKIGEVHAGEKIATVILGSSPCSTGTHLHFEVREGAIPKNPALFLRPPSQVIWDNAPDSPFDFTGSWRWPVDEPIRITQGYGNTFYARVRRYYGGQPHTGIDMVGSNQNVYAVKEGILYNGSIRCGGGFLRYVRVKHKDSNISTYYLHINYVKT